MLRVWELLALLSFIVVSCSAQNYAHCSTQNPCATIRCAAGFYPVRGVGPDGCPNCRCERCPLVRCSGSCPYGFKRDERGCQTCQCACSTEDPCALVDCAPGFIPVRGTGSDGCPTCDCVRCPIPGCSRPCPNGFKKDARGCQTCDCVECPTIDPCATVLCGPGSTVKREPGPDGCLTCRCVSTDERPGLCPAPTPGQVGICIAECTFDAECPGRQKCCGNCPRKCSNPTFPTGDKPGQCPVRDPGLIGPCVVRCNGDHSCPGDQKCCGSCPLECTDPVKKPVVKPGQCPRRRITGTPAVGPCVAFCEDDSSCPGNQKCCGGCPRQCTSPVTSGQCPPRFRRPRPCRRKLRDRCQSNADCRRGRICCGSCPKRCIRPRRFRNRSAS